MLGFRKVIELAAPVGLGRSYLVSLNSLADSSDVEDPLGEPTGIGV